MLAPRIRGAFVPVAFGLVAVISACSNGTEPVQSLCSASNPVSLNVGEVRPSISGGCIYISSSSGGEYALVPFNSDTAFKNGAATISFTSQGAATVLTPVTSIAAANAPLFSTVPGQISSTSLQPATGIDLRMREIERRFLAPRIPAARAWYRNRFASTGNTRLSPSFSASAAWQVGDQVTLNAKVSNPCDTLDNRTGRVAAISNTAIIVDDVNNPTGGYTDTEYQTIALQFDSVFTMDTTAFGAPTDIDANGHVILFFTRAVNEQTPTGSSSVVGGFFYPRDLFPKQGTTDLQACPTSNVAEMFYLLVPDPNGVVNGNVRTKSFVQHLTVMTTAHEFQHLINAARRMYVNTAATDFEVLWLNEGLSHIAEELLFYQQSAALSPRHDIDSTAFKGNQQNVDAYNFDQQQNFGRFRSYLLKPSTNSPYAPNDSLPTRGATWSFLRYAADHRGSSDGDTWRKLDNSTTTGIANLQNVFGSGLTSIFRDWAIANITDDVPGSTSVAEWQHPSWNFRSVFTFIPNQRSYPLSTVTVGDGSPLTVTVNGGSAAYVRFTIAAGQVGSVKWDIPTTATGVSVSLVRLK